MSYFFRASSLVSGFSLETGFFNKFSPTCTNKFILASVALSIWVVVPVNAFSWYYRQRKEHKIKGEEMVKKVFTLTLINLQIILYSRRFNLCDIILFLFYYKKNDNLQSFRLAIDFGNSFSKNLKTLFVQKYDQFLSKKKKIKFSKIDLGQFWVKFFLPHTKFQIFFKQNACPNRTSFFKNYFLTQLEKLFFQVEPNPCPNAS